MNPRTAALRRPSTSPLAAAGLALLVACSGRPERQADREPPRVAALTPAPGDANVWVRAPIRATFTEPLLRDSVTDASVLLSNAAGAAVSKQLRLSADGLALTIEPAVVPVAPATFTVTLTDALRDFEGNALVAPAPAWTFSFPFWVELGAGVSPEAAEAGAPQAAVDPAGRAWVAWRWGGELAGPSGPVAGSEIRVASWDGAAWAPVGGRLNLDPTQGASRPALALEDGTGLPVVAWNETLGVAGSGLYVKRWDGAAWQPLGGVLNFDPSRDTAGRRLATGPGALVAGWEEYADVGLRVHAKRWNGTSWEVVGGGPAVSEAEAALSPELSGLAVDDQGRVWLGVEFDGTVRIRRADGAAWISVGTPLAGGTGWVGVGGSTCAVAVAAPVSCAGGTCGELQVQTWTGSAWQAAGAAASCSETERFRGAAVGVLPDGVVVAYQRQAAGGEGQLPVARWSGSAWAPMGEALLTSPAGFLYEPTLAFDSGGVAYVASERRGSGSDARTTAHVFRENR